jgi:large subunit ribosomal protein L29
MKKEEIKELSIQELKASIEVAEKAYRELKVTHAISPIDNPSKITKDRREIARLKTVLRQKEIEAAKAEVPAENN